MAKEIKMTAFVYPGCIVVANTSAKAVSGNYPEIARIFHDRTIKWERKRITEQMRKYVEDLANEPFVESYYQGPNFYEK
jgi:hypothetical protein